MKLYFSASISSTKEGETHSAESVRESLKKLISNHFNLIKQVGRVNNIIKNKHINKDLMGKNKKKRCYIYFLG